MSATIIARRLQIFGHVQGVGFRAFVKHHAELLSLDGFVRNRKDNSVEALVIGAQEQVEALIALCHKGPLASRVDKVEISEAQGVVEKGFRQLLTV